MLYKNAWKNLSSWPSRRPLLRGRPLLRVGATPAASTLHALVTVLRYCLMGRCLSSEAPPLPVPSQVQSCTIHQPGRGALPSVRSDSDGGLHGAGRSGLGDARIRVLSASVIARASFVDPVDIKFKVEGQGQQVIEVRNARETVVQQIVIGRGGHTGGESRPGTVESRGPSHCKLTVIDSSLRSGVSRNSLKDAEPLAQTR